jgi:hypothetical protein
MRRRIPLLFIAVFLCALPAMAVLQEVTVSGTVFGYDRANNTLTIAHPVQYGCSYTTGGEKTCSLTPMEAETLTGSIPMESVLSIIHPDDPVMATSIGGAGGTWISVAKVAGTGDGRTVTDIVGEPSAIPLPLAGNYSLELTPLPDCTACSGTTCTAASSSVKTLSEGRLVSSGNLPPKASATYSGRNDGSSITVTFVKGEASSSTCAGRKPGMTGPQPVSVYIIHVVPPVGSAAVENPSATPSGTPPEVTMPAEARPTTAKSGMLPIAAIGALVIVAVSGILRLR